jgi:LmbE family N-acetylglucosaminyl deacetylase
VEAVEDAIRNCRPSLVITHAYEGGDPDRDSASLATSSACQSVPTRALRILEFPLCHSDCDGTMVAGEFLHEALWPPTDIVLPSPCEVAMKKRVLGTYRSQREKWDGLSEGPEVFRPLPPYDYTRSPHCWPVWYEMSNGRTTMPQWLESARLFLKTRQPAAEVRG